MKKMGVFFMALFTLGAAAAMAQTVADKKFEVSASIAFQSVGWEEDSSSAFNLATRLGYFLWKGLEFEPEIMVTAMEDNTGYMLTGNFSYNFKTSSKKVVPFVLAGYGFGSGYSILGLVLDYDETLTTLNLGGGLKYLVGDIAAFRIEYRFRQFYWEGESEMSDHQVLVGIALFF